ncbi:hypothetical protein BHM03_00045229, partial [Ensete ventricosum]
WLLGRLRGKRWELGQYRQTKWNPLFRAKVLSTALDTLLSVVSFRSTAFGTLLRTNVTRQSLTPADKPLAAKLMFLGVRSESVPKESILTYRIELTSHGIHPAVKKEETPLLKDRALKIPTPPAKNNNGNTQNDLVGH